MLSEKYRLKKTKDFDRVFQGGKRAKGRGFAVRAKENGTEVSRFGVVVSKKVSLKATERNRIRRIISEAIRTGLQEIKAGWDVSIIVFPDFDLKTTIEAKEELWRTFSRTGLLISKQ